LEGFILSILDTGIKNVRNVLGYNIGQGAINGLEALLAPLRNVDQPVVVYIDEFFITRPDIVAGLKLHDDDHIVFVKTEDEPSTGYVDQCVSNLHDLGIHLPSAIVGMGGGITLDVGKAVSNMLTNGGLAEEYQGWDLVRRPGIFKVAIPTLSGTGAEATRTCVMTNKRTGIKMGMNSDYTVYDRIIMDPNLTATVPPEQYFFTGMDAFIHCIEAISGSYRNAIGDAFSRETINLCRTVFNSQQMMSAANREKLMVASYLGGCSIATSYVGVVHPLSAGLSVVLGLHHCVANCIVMRVMEEFYPEAFDEFWSMVAIQNIEVPFGLCEDLSDEKYELLYKASIVHEKPLTNALGPNFKKILTKDKVISLFKSM
jgi:3-deoxy-alpha-D-manno-octulosonate 8-oxidase